MGSHYETLGVAPNAKHDDIRRAYHEAARRWHPDGFSGRPNPEAEAASESMRSLNEAWRVLGDPARRSEYDGRRRSGQPLATSGSAHIRTENGVTRIDPRLIDPRVLAEQRQAQEMTREAGHSSIIRVLPVVSFFVLIIGIFVFTAYARGSSGIQPEPGRFGPGDESPAVQAPQRDSQVTLPGPNIGVAAGACVRIQSGPSLIEVPCTGTIDGRVIGAYEAGGSCPALTIREVTLSNEITVCLGV